MLTLDVKANDFASILELHLSALGYGMFYHKPYSVGSQVVGAEGTLFTVTSASMVACTMAARNRLIIHASIPCANVDNNTGDLYALEAPKNFDRVLRRLGDQHVALRFDESCLEIVLPRPGNARRIIWLPLKRIVGHMLSANSGEAATTFRLNADALIAALCRVPRGEHWNLVSIKPTDEGFEFQYPINGAAASERLPATTLKQNGTTSRFVCSTRSITGFVRVLKSLRKRSPTIRVQISTSTLTVWNDSFTVQFFADRIPSDWKRPSIPDTNSDIPEIQLLLDRRMSDLPKGVGRWLRRLVRNALTNREKVETTWTLTRNLVVVQLECGLETSFEMPCACDFWPMQDDHVSLSVSPLTTAAMLECCEEDTPGCRLVYHDCILTVQSGSQPYQLTTRASLNKNSQAVRLGTADVHITGIAKQAVPTHERGK